MKRCKEEHYIKKEMKLFWRWYDLWVGAYYDREHRTLYICPLPTLGVRIQLSRPDGTAGLRSEEFPCEDYDPRPPRLGDSQDCDADGHYLCASCCHKRPAPADTKCSGCHNEIDLDVCHCGVLRENHAYVDDHAFVPQGCICGYGKGW